MSSLKKVYFGPITTNRSQEENSYTFVWFIYYTFKAIKTVGTYVVGDVFGYRPPPTISIIYYPP